MIDVELGSVCRDAVRSVDWGKVHDLQDPGWGLDEPDWSTWGHLYGTKSLIISPVLYFT